MEKLRRLEDKLMELDREIQELKASAELRNVPKEEIIESRPCVVNDGQNQNGTNEIPVVEIHHHGNILADILTIQQLAPYDEERVTIWKNLFPEYYGVSFNFVPSHMSNLPFWLPFVLNTRATAYSLHGEQTYTDKAVCLRIINIADKIVKKWSEDNSLTYKDPEMDELLKQFSREQVRLFHGS